MQKGHFHRVAEKALALQWGGVSGEKGVKAGRVLAYPYLVLKTNFGQLYIGLTTKGQSLE